ncbi:MAG: histidine kinase N-terminal 7TM domain-containing protein [Pseudomonadales bacterium]
MTFYAIPSFCAILIKAWLLWRGRSGARKYSALVLLLCALLVMNLVEFSMFMLPDKPREIAWLVHIYYFAATFSAAAILNLFLYMTGDAANNLTKLNWALATVISAVTLIPGVIIAGIENIGYTWMRIPGSFYVMWTVYIVSTLLFSLFLLVSGYKRSRDMLQRRRCLAVLLGLSPFICCAIGVIVLMLLGVKINATLVLSSAVIFFLIALIYSEQRHGLFKILARVPFTEEYALRSELASLVRKIESSAFGSADQLAFKDQIKKIESLYVELAIVANDGNKTHAAAALGISNATLHRKAPRKREKATTRCNPDDGGKTLRWAPARSYSTLDGNDK